MAEILCSIGAIISKPNGRNYRKLEELAKQLDCDGYEFMMEKPWYDEMGDLTAYLKDIQLYMPVMHCEKSIGEKISLGGKENLSEVLRLFEINCKLAKAIRSKKLVIHLWGGRTSDSRFENNINTYAVLKERAEYYGLELLVENVVCNKQDPLTHICELAHIYPGIGFVVDTKMAAFHSQQEKIYEPEYSWLWQEGHIRHYHINDYAGGYMDWPNLTTLVIGDGKIDFKKFFHLVRETGYDGTFTTEASAYFSDGNVNVEKLNRQFQRIREYLR
ncbi:MAG: sugar phosphate isomerase/epimerase [Lachnospiraceae bacterium]|nr:sugar phosphate isomerase/epimerase [Lachnospiraceae bacterium]